MKKNLFAASSLLLVFTLFLAPAQAASPWVGQGTYVEQAKNKLDFGLKNLLAGWTEIFAKPNEYIKDGKPFMKGVGHGFYNFVVFTIGGALHVLTFPVTQIDLPIPKNGVNF